MTLRSVSRREGHGRPRGHARTVVEATGTPNHPLYRGHARVPSIIQISSQPERETPNIRFTQHEGTGHANRTSPADPSLPPCPVCAPRVLPRPPGDNQHPELHVCRDLGLLRRVSTQVCIPEPRATGTYLSCPRGPDGEMVNVCCLRCQVVGQLGNGYDGPPRPRTALCLLHVHAGVRGPPGKGQRVAVLGVLRRLESVATRAASSRDRITAW